MIHCWLETLPARGFVSFSLGRFNESAQQARRLCQLLLPPRRLCQGARVYRYALLPTTPSSAWGNGKDPFWIKNVGHEACTLHGYAVNFASPTMSTYVRWSTSIDAEASAARFGSVHGDDSRRAPSCSLKDPRRDRPSRLRVRSRPRSWHRARRVSALSSSPTTTELRDASTLECYAP